MRWIKKLAIGLLVLVLAVAAGAWWAVRSSLPNFDLNAAIPGLSGPVEVVRDANAIPHIRAKNEQDAYAALGFVHAQDRLWQMDMNRRIAAGRTAEILGDKALDTDVFLRTLGVRRNAEEIAKRMEPGPRAMYEAYARGVNAYLAQRKGLLPPEFLILRAPAPEPWTVADTLSWNTMMAWSLNGNWQNEVLRFRLALGTQLTTAQIQEAVHPYPGEKPASETRTTLDFAKLYRELDRKLAQGLADDAGQLVARAPMAYQEGMGSNNWVVGGARTETGKPLLANDPHLGLDAPALWYMAHLETPTLNVVGATLPGIPGVVLGRNDKLAWGFTNTGPDVSDLFLERINPNNPDEYQTPDGFKAFEVIKETVKVKGAADVPLTIRKTRHGPVVSGVWPNSMGAAKDATPRGYALAFSWPSIMPDDRTYLPILSYQKANSIEAFREAMREFGGPMQNMVLADVEGNIGMVQPGRIPLRRADNDLMGAAPAPGWDAKYDWQGFVPYDQLYFVKNPPSNVIATANERTVPLDFQPYLTSEWHWPYRARRIKELMDATPKHSMASFQKMHADIKSLWVADLLPQLLKAKPQWDEGKRALELLALWDASMQPDRPEGLIATAWLREISRSIYADEFGNALMKDVFEQRGQLVADALSDREGKSRWCDIVTTPKKETCGDLLVPALEAALANLKKRYGADMARWRWGDAHFARSEHRPFARVAPLAKYFDVRVPTGGDTFTVNVGRHQMRNEAEPYANRHAASVRFLHDLSNLENSQFIHSTGQSGHFLSKHYKDWATPWADVQYRPMQMRQENYGKGALGKMMLSPQ